MQLWQLLLQHYSKNIRNEIKFKPVGQIILAQLFRKSVLALVKMKSIWLAPSLVGFNTKLTNKNIPNPALKPTRLRRSA